MEENEQVEDKRRNGLEKKPSPTSDSTYMCCITLYICMRFNKSLQLFPICLAKIQRKEGLHKTSKQHCVYCYRYTITQNNMTLIFIECELTRF